MDMCFPFHYNSLLTGFKFITRKNKIKLGSFINKQCYQTFIFIYLFFLLQKHRIKQLDQKIHYYSQILFINRNQLKVKFHIKSCYHQILHYIINLSNFILRAQQFIKSPNYFQSYSNSDQFIPRNYQVCNIHFIIYFRPV